MPNSEGELKASHAVNSDRVEYGAWAVVLGLVLEIIELAYPVDKLWQKAIPTGIIAIGVWAEIIFGRKARSAAEELQDIGERRTAPRQLTPGQLTIVATDMLAWAT